jgi:hypothetical protein
MAKLLKVWSLEDHEKVWYSDESKITIDWGRPFVKVQEG